MKHWLDIKGYGPVRLSVRRGSWYGRPAAIIASPGLCDVLVVERGCKCCHDQWLVYAGQRSWYE